MRKLFYPLFIAAALCAASCITDKEEGNGSDYALEAGDELPSFKVVMNDGKTLTTESLRGKTSLIMLFTTSCPDCQATLPVVEEAYQTYGGEVEFVCISRSEGEKKIQAYWETEGLNLPYSAQEGREVYALFASSVVPRIYISDEDLRIKHAYSDKPRLDYETLSQAIMGTLGE